MPFFDNDGAVDHRLVLARAYRATFESPAGAAEDLAGIVMDDLARFCHFRSSLVGGVDDDMGRRDPLKMAELEGRRQVYLRILGLMEITEQELRDLVLSEDEENQ